jgi:hypothetical protein
MRICSTRMTEVTAAIAGTGSSPQRERHWRAASSIGSNGGVAAMAQPATRAAIRYSRADRRSAVSSRSAP